MLVKYLSYYCPVGRLFGNRVRAASIGFLDTLLPPLTQRRPGVGISRETLTARDKSLYRVETTSTGIEIPVVMIGEVEQIGSAPARLLAATLRAVEEVGLSIGGRKSAGLGLLKLTSADFHIVKVGKEQDRNGALLANPFKAPTMRLADFARLLFG